jgi:hypothetical protein
MTFTERSMTPPSTTWSIRVCGLKEAQELAAHSAEPISTGGMLGAVAVVDANDAIELRFSGGLVVARDRGFATPDDRRRRSTNACVT